MGSSEAGNGASRTGGRYRFDGIVVDAAAHTLCRDATEIAVEPKSFAVLLALLRRPGELVTRDELLDGVWGHRHVTPGVLTRAIAQLRAALDDHSHQPRYIQTQHALGYRFIGQLEPEAESEALADCAASPDRAGPAAAQAEEHGTGGASRDPLGAPGLVIAAITPPDPADAPPPVHHRSLRHWGMATVAMLLVVLVLAFCDRRERASARPAEASVAVLPFTNLSGDRDSDYFAEGLEVELHDALAGVRGLKVAARLSPTTVAAQGGDARALGALLGVATVLDASVRREGRRVRINARLYDCATGYTLWSRSYERELSRVFDAQIGIADEVVASLMEVLPQQREAIARRLAPPRSAAAFDAYLRGLKQLLQPGGDKDADSAIGYFNQALSEDSGYARAQAGICRAEVLKFTEHNDPDASQRARHACEQARKMDPGLSRVNLALAELHHAHGEYGKAVEYYALAESDPASRPAAYVGIAIVHAEQGQRAQALDYFNRALAMRPGDASIHAQIGYQDYLAGELPKAIASYRKAVQLQPDNADLWSYLGGIYLTAGDDAQAERALERSIAIRPNYAALTNLGEIRYLSGHPADAVALQLQAVQLEPSDFLPWGNLAQARLADPATATQAGEAFREAAERAQRYVELRPGDAKALAALGWYRANLGQPALARQLLARAEALGNEPGEVALLNAQTLTRLGELDEARQRIAAARAAGIVANRIDGNAALRAALAVPATADRRRSTAAGTGQRPTPGG